MKLEHQADEAVKDWKMEQIYECDGLPSSLSTNNPWFVANNLNDNGMVSFYTTIDEQPTNYRCRIPELRGLGIQGFGHGWMILSNYPHYVMWSLWNPVTSKFIRLPRLEGGLDENEMGYCCLSSPPGDPASILLLMRYDKPNFVFCRLDCSKRKRRWTEMSYANQLKRLMGTGEEEGDIRLDFPTCCNGKVYALSHDTLSVVQVAIKVVKDKQVVITILPFQNYPPIPQIYSLPDFCVLKGSSTELFVIMGRVDAPAGVSLFKLDMTTTTPTWEEINDLKDDVFFLDLGNLQPASYIPAVASGLGGYVHIRDNGGMILNSFHVKDKILLVWLMPCLGKASQISMWEEYRGLEAGNDRQVKCTDDHKQEEDKEKDDEIVVVSNTDESRLLDVPFHVLEMIMEHCVGLEYMNMRATCKRCHLAAPQIHWRSKTALRKLQNYSLVSPWLMVVQENGDNLNFTDPVSGDNYLMKSALVSLISDEFKSISCSKYGWWLFYTRSSNEGGDHHLTFFNPFTNDVRKLPPTPPHYLDNLCFSAPPTCTDCMVVGFSTNAHVAYILRYHQLLWRRFDVLDYSFCFPTFRGRDLYALRNEEGQLVVFKDTREGRVCQPEVVAAAQPPEPLLFKPQYFLMKRDEYLLLVIVGEFGGDPHVYEFNDSTEEWNQIQSLEKHMIFIGGATSTCICIEAKTPKMQNKIFFPRLKDGKLIFYSLETSKYHTIDGKLATSREEEYPYCFLSFRSTIHLSLHAWIEPSWY